MLELSEHAGIEQLKPPTSFKLFESVNVIGSSDSISKAYKRATSRSRKIPRMPNNGNNAEFSITNIVNQLTPLLANDALQQAVSQVQLPVDGWVFKLFIVLVQPPPDLNLGEINGLFDYLTGLQVEIGKLADNGTRTIVRHCWWALQSKHSTPLWI